VVHHDEGREVEVEKGKKANPTFWKNNPEASREQQSTASRERSLSLAQ
jgi:hypothetical protein